MFSVKFKALLLLAVAQIVIADNPELNEEKTNDAILAEYKSVMGRISRAKPYTAVRLGSANGAVEIQLIVEKEEFTEKEAMRHIVIDGGRISCIGDIGKTLRNIEEADSFIAKIKLEFEEE